MRAISRNGLVRKADQAFSRYIRQRHANEGGWVECCTCGKAMHWSECDAGHFVKRGHAAARFDERNVHPQCTGCNHFRDGAQDEYAAFIVRTYGEQVLHELLALKRAVKRWSAAELRELVEKYRGG